MNAALEFHDSTLSSVVTVGTDCVLRFDGYLHQSQGRAGVDPGTGWQCLVELRLRQGRRDGSVPELPVALSDGTLHLGASVFENCVPIPLQDLRATRIELIAVSGERVVFTGASLEAALVTEPKYVDTFPGAGPEYEQP